MCFGDRSPNASYNSRGTFDYTIYLIRSTSNCLIFHLKLLWKARFVFVLEYVMGFHSQRSPETLTKEPIKCSRGC